MRSVSAVQAVMACIVGAVIIQNCHDVLSDRHWLTNSYLCFGVSYFYYDAWAMYQAYWYKHEELHDKSTFQGYWQFTRANKLMMVHHLIFPIFYFPVIAWFRRGVGDFFVGCFYCIELAIPCISLRGVLLQVGLGSSRLYDINGVILIVTFFICRVLIFPFMYWSYGIQKKLSLLQVVVSIPKKCNFGCLAILAFQVYWMVQMIYILLRTLKTRLKRSPSITAMKIS